MTIENCFSCMDLKEVKNEDGKFYCAIWKKVIYNPRHAGCEKIRFPDRIRWDKRIKLYYDEEIGMWY